MKINKDSLSARINNIVKAEGITASYAYSRFFFDAFLKRLAQSPYRDNFVLKGGLLLSSLIGASERSTVDIDFLMQKRSLELNNLIKEFQEIIGNSSVDDGIEFKLLGSKPIRQEDVYGGFSLRFIGRLDNVKIPFSIDVATGDPVTPEAKDYSYKSLISNDTILLKAYPLETVISEKFETVIEKGVLNSRLKDFYDLWLLMKQKDSFIDVNCIRNAFVRTCRYRQFSKTKDEVLSIIKNIEQSDTLLQRWIFYKRKNKYVENLEWSEIIVSLRFWADRLI